MRVLVGALIAVSALAMPATVAPVRADVLSATAGSFEIKRQVTIDAPIKQVWDTLRAPSRWWSKEHTYSGDSANLYLDSQATGCFCEKIPGKGSVEHAHILYVEAPRMIRLSGALGPLQADAVTGTLSFRLDPEGDNATRVTVVYIVGGFMREGGEALAPKVDDVLGIQLDGLKAAAEVAPPAEPDARPRPQAQPHR